METAQHPTTDLMLGSPFLTWPFPTIVPVVPLQPLPSIVVATAKLTALHWPNPAPKRSQRTSIQLFCCGRRVVFHASAFVRLAACATVFRRRSWALAVQTKTARATSGPEVMTSQID